MTLRKFLSVALLALMATTVSAQQIDRSMIPQIPVDKNVRIGKLDNGLTYYIRYNNWPENKANFYIAQRVGSIQENDDQRGLAHFLEHMAFNGSEHFPDSTLLEYTRSLGVEFGSDLNAYTSIDQTVYRICDVPTKRATAIDSCILILKDWSNGLTLDGKEIDKERGVIHQEWQLRTGPQYRIFERTLPKLYPGSKYGERLPIGLMSIIDNFPHKALRDYYKKWYRPDNQAIIVVGDVDVDHVEAYIKKLWKDVKVPAGAAQVVDEFVPDNEQAIYVMDKDKEQQFSEVSISMKHDAQKPEEKVGIDYLLSVYAKSLIRMMIGMRLSEMSQKADCPFVSAYGSDGTYIYSKTKDAFSMEGYAKDGKDIETVAALYREAQRIRQFGFTPGEFSRSAEEYMSRLEKQYTNRNKITNDVFGNAYRDHYLENEPIPSIEDEYQLMKQLTPALSVDMINMIVKELISDNDKNLVVTIFTQEKEGKVYPTEAEMAQAIQNVRTEQLEAYVDNAKNEPIMDPKKMPKKGKIKKEKTNSLFGYKELTLSNGARVILKKTDFKDDEIRFRASSRGGKGLYGAADYANLKMFDVAVRTSGLGNFSNTELTKALYGKQAHISMGMSDYYQTMSGSSVPKDIETMMQLVYLHFTDIQKDEEAYQAMVAQIDLMLKNKNLNPESALSDSISTTLYNHHPRFIPLNVEDVNAANYDRMLKMAKERFANAADFTFYFIGNFDEATLRPLIEQYIASLPGKKKTAKWQEVPSFAKGKVNNTFLRKGEVPKATAFEFWHMPMAYNVENEILADAAGQVLSMVYLKDIREDASAAYSVSASGALAKLGDLSQAFMQVYCPMDPEKAQLALDLIAQGFKNNTLAVDMDKVMKVKENMLKNIETAVKTNGYWVNTINNYLENGVDMHSNYVKAVNDITPEKIADFLKQMLAAGNHIQVVMLPEK